MLPLVKKLFSYSVSENLAEERGTSLFNSLSYLTTC